MSCRRNTVDRGSPDPHGVFNFHARRARRPTPATAGHGNRRGWNPGGARVRPMGLPISGEDTSGDKPAPSDAPPGCAVRSFSPLRGQEVPQSRSPLFSTAAGTVEARRSDRGREEPLLSRRPHEAGRQPARSIGLAIGFRGTRDRGFGLQDTCPHAGIVPESQPGPLNAACARKRRVSHGRSDDDSGSV